MGWARQAFIVAISGIGNIDGIEILRCSNRLELGSPLLDFVERIPG